MDNDKQTISKDEFADMLTNFIIETGKIMREHPLPEETLREEAVVDRKPLRITLDGIVENPMLIEQMNYQSLFNMAGRLKRAAINEVREATKLRIVFDREQYDKTWEDVVLKEYFLLRDEIKIRNEVKKAVKEKHGLKCKKELDKIGDKIGDKVSDGVSDKINGRVGDMIGDVSVGKLSTIIESGRITLRSIYKYPHLVDEMSDRAIYNMSARLRNEAKDMMTRKGGVANAMFSEDKKIRWEDIVPREYFLLRDELAKRKEAKKLLKRIGGQRYGRDDINGEDYKTAWESNFKEEEN